MKRQILALATALALAACAAPPAAPPTPTIAEPPVATLPPPPPQPTEAPPTAAPPTAQPSPAAAPTEAPAALLPAPLYVLELGQVARIERDGVTRALLTSEQVEVDGVRPIAEFALAPAALAYVVADLEADRLVVADARGQSPRTIYEESGHELSDLVFAPDGESLLFRLLNNRQPPDLAAGIYRLPLVGGAPELLRADDPVDDPVNPSRAVSGYRPIAFSPDGSRLLVGVNASFYEDCTLGFMDPAGGDVARVAVPEGQQVYCGEQAWSPDGASALFLAGPAAGEQPGPTLWRADAATAAAEPLLPPTTFARAPLALPGGAARFFLARLERDSAGVATAATFLPAEIGAAGGAPAELGAAFPEFLSRALWAPDGSGAAVDLSTDERRSLLRWLPVGGEPVELPSSSDGIVGMAWGVE